MSIKCSPKALFNNKTVQLVDGESMFFYLNEMKEFSQNRHFFNFLTQEFSSVKKDL